MSDVIVRLIRRKTSPGRTERTGDTHAMYCYWEQNDRAYKATITCNVETYHAKLHSLVERVHASIVKKGGTAMVIDFDPSVLTPPRD